MKTEQGKSLRRLAEERNALQSSTNATLANIEEFERMCRPKDTVKVLTDYQPRKGSW